MEELTLESAMMQADARIAQANAVATPVVLPDDDDEDDEDDEE